jgi:hypothetical protein
MLATQIETGLAIVPSVDGLPGTTAPAAGANGISLQHVLARSTVIEWPEAVAIVEELCAVLIKNRTQLVPDVSEVRITAQGAVEVGAALSGDGPPARLDRLLQSRLSTAGLATTDAVSTGDAVASPIPQQDAPGATAADPIAVRTTEVVTIRAANSPIYSTEDLDVRPPVLADSQIVQSALPEIDGPVVNTLEVLVAEDGSVERVRMLSRPRRMADMMVLSGVKMWKFRPASRNGRPVKYLTVMEWTVTP